MVNEANIDRHNCVDFNFFRNQIKKEGSVNTVDPNFSSAVNVRYFFPKAIIFCRYDYGYGSLVRGSIFVVIVFFVVDKYGKGRAQFSNRTEMSCETFKLIFAERNIILSRGSQKKGNWQTNSAYYLISEENGIYSNRTEVFFSIKYCDQSRHQRGDIKNRIFFVGTRARRDWETGNMGRRR